MAEEEHSHIASPIAETPDEAEEERRDITISIVQMLCSVEAPTRKKCCIYKVPPEIRKPNDVYTPKVVSIGPFHLDKEILQEMQSLKLTYLKRFLQRTRANLDSLVKLVVDLRGEIYACYSQLEQGPIFYEVDKILIDAGFILELFYQFYYMDLEMDDAYPEENWTRYDLVMELFLLENQLPFFLLQNIFNLANATPERSYHPTLLKLIFCAFDYHNKQYLTPESVTICHLTDLLRKFYLTPSQRGPTEHDGIKYLSAVSSVTELYEAGVKCIADKGSRCPLDLQFSGRTLIIPQLIVDEETEMLFGNMMALEKSCHSHEQYIWGYVFLLRCLMKTVEDAGVLVENGIIVNYLNHNIDVVLLFYRLGKNTPVVPANSEYHLLSERLNYFCGERKKRMVTTLRRDYYIDLKRNYCKTPLQTLGTVGGVLLLVLTAIQTVCSILQAL